MHCSARKTAPAEMFRPCIAVALLVTGCAATGPSDTSAEPGQNPISCTATCQTTYTQCTGGCIGAADDTPSICHATCDRVIEECLKRCTKPPDAH